MMKKIAAIGLPVLLSMSLVACGTAGDDSSSAATTVGSATEQSTEDSASADETASADDTASSEVAEDTSESVSVSNVSSVEGSLLDTSDLFTERDMEQSANLLGATQIDLVSGQDVTLTEEGVYVVSGEATDVTIIVEADDEAKVQIVLDGVDIENEDAPAIYVKSADKVFVTTTSSDNVLEVTGSYEADGDVNLDAVIFSKDDLVLNGTGTLTVVSAQGNGITSKDDLKVTGGTYSITSRLDALEANDSIRIAGGDITIVTDKDGLHSEYDEDLSGYVYISGGTLNITAADDAILGTTIVQIDGGVINIETSTEGIEATQIQVNGGEINIYSTDDGFNATAKSNLSVMIEVNGGTINVSVGNGDTDAFDSNGTLSINGGTIDVTAPTSAFDTNGTAELNGGTVTVNGEVITEITQTHMGGGGDTRPGGGRRG